MSGILNALVGSYAPAGGSFESIATVIVGSGGASSVSFNSIGTDWTHLQIRYVARDNAAQTNNNIFVTFNGDSGSNYAWHYLTGDGSTAFAGANINTPSILAGKESSATSSTSTFGVGVIDILDYRNTNKFKTLRALTGNDNNGNGNLFLASGLWRSTSAITSITLTSDSTQQQNTTFALYGIKGA